MPMIMRITTFSKNLFIVSVGPISAEEPVRSVKMFFAGNFDLHALNVTGYWVKGSFSVVSDEFSVLIQDDGSPESSPRGNNMETDGNRRTGHILFGFRFISSEVGDGGPMEGEHGQVKAEAEFVSGKSGAYGVPCRHLERHRRC